MQCSGVEYDISAALNLLKERKGGNKARLGVVGAHDAFAGRQGRKEGGKEGAWLGWATG